MLMWEKITLLTIRDRTQIEKVSEQKLKVLHTTTLFPILSRPKLHKILSILKWKLYALLPVNTLQLLNIKIKLLFSNMQHKNYR